MLSSSSMIKKTLSHPMLLLIAGAIISSLIIPYFTRQWQDHQKELELKSDLADQINKAVSNTLTVIALNLNAGYNTNQTGGSQRYVNVFIDWQISKDVIGSKMKIYFSNDQITKDWDNLSY